jgi:hypothetical protein
MASLRNGVQPFPSFLTEDGRAMDLSDEQEANADSGIQSTFEPRQNSTVRMLPQKPKPESSEFEFLKKVHIIKAESENSSQSKDRLSTRNIDFHYQPRFDSFEKEEGCSNSSSRRMPESKAPLATHGRQTGRIQSRATSILVQR